MDVRARIIVSGFVQGVGFRSYALRAATKLGLAGYVRNLRDGKVEVVVEGNRGLLEELIGDLWRGPLFGHVTDVGVEWQEYKGDFHGFRVAF